MSLIPKVGAFLWLSARVVALMVLALFLAVGVVDCRQRYRRPSPEMQLLMSAIHAADCKEVGALVDQYPQLINQQRPTLTPLTYAAEKGKLNVVMLLLARGADVNLADGRGRGPLHQAALSGDMGMIEVLLKAGANPSAQTDSGSTPRILAQRSTHSAAVRVLGEAEAAQRKGTRGRAATAP